jgi:hypothetical protein
VYIYVLRGAQNTFHVEVVTVGCVISKLRLEKAHARYFKFMQPTSSCGNRNKSIKFSKMAAALMSALFTNNECRSPA